MMRSVMILCASLTLWACEKSPANPADKSASAAGQGPTGNAPAPIAFAPTQDNLLFTYVDARGNVLSVDKAADVPSDRRENVMVVDLSRSPEERQADRYVYFADLTVKDPEGRHVANVVSRYRAAAAAPGQAEVFTQESQKNEVLVYSAEWCGYCKKTKAFLKEHGVPYRERDVEKDSGAEAELQRKAKAAGVRVSGVPVTDFMGELVMGFDQAKLNTLIKRRPSTAPTP
jgi:mycoredoxin